MSIVSIRLNLTEPGSDPLKYLLNDSNRLLVVYSRTQIRLVDILAKKVLFSYNPNNGSITRVSLINNLLVLALKKQGELFLQIRNLQNIYSSRDYIIQDAIASICEISHLKQKEGITGILFGHSHGRISQYNEFDHSLTEYLSIHNHLHQHTFKPEKIQQIECDIAAGHLIVLTNMSRLLIFNAERKELICAVTPELGKKRVAILDFAMYGDAKKPMLGVLLEIQGNLCIHSASLSILDRESLWADRFEEKVLENSSIPHYRFGTFYDIAGTDTKSLFFISKMLQGQLKITVYTPREILSYVYSYDALIKTQKMNNFNDASISSCSVDSERPKIKVTTIFDQGVTILRDTIEFNPDKLEYIFLHARNLFQDFQLSLESEHRLREVLEALEGKVISPDEPLRELFFVTAIDKGFYRAIIDILKDSAERADRIYTEFLKLARSALLLKQNHVGNIDIETNSETIVSYRGFLMGLKVILDYISNELSDHYHDSILDEESEEPESSEIKSKKDDDMIDIGEENILNLDENLRDLTQNVDNELFYTNVILWMQTNQFYDHFLKSLGQIVEKWDNRKKLLQAYAQRAKAPESIDTQFSIDLLSLNSESSQFEYPTKPDQILSWIRTNPDKFEKKFLLYYIISEDLFLSEPFYSRANSSRLCSELFTNAFNLTDEDVSIASGMICLDRLIDYIPIQHDKISPNKIISEIKSREFTQNARDACSYLVGHEIKDDSWKLFILNKFLNFDCGDELSLFVRGGGIRWDEKDNAKRLILIFMKYNKFVQAYNFVRALVAGDYESESTSGNFQELFFFFLEQAIQEKQIAQVFKLSLRSYEEELVEEFLSSNQKHSNLYLLFLIHKNNIIKALGYALRTPSIEPFTLSLLYAKIKELPDLYRESAESNFNTYLGHRMRSREFSDSSMNTFFDEEAKNSEFYHGHQGSQRKSVLQKAKSFAEIVEEEKKRDYNEGSLGLRIGQKRQNQKGAKKQEKVNGKEKQGPKKKEKTRIRRKKRRDYFDEEDEESSSQLQKKKRGRSVRSKMRSGIAGKGFNPSDDPIPETDRHTRSMDKKR